MTSQVVKRPREDNEEELPPKKFLTVPFSSSINTPSQFNMGVVGLPFQRPLLIDTSQSPPVIDEPMEPITPINKPISATTPIDIQMKPLPPPRPPAPDVDMNAAARKEMIDQAKELKKKQDERTEVLKSMATAKDVLTAFHKSEKTKREEEVKKALENFGKEKSKQDLSNPSATSVAVSTLQSIGTQLGSKPQSEKDIKSAAAAILATAIIGAVGYGSTLLYDKLKGRFSKTEKQKAEIAAKKEADRLKKEQSVALKKEQAAALKIKK